MKIVALITNIAFLSLALHVSAEHAGAMHSEVSDGHHDERANNGEYASYEPSDSIPRDERFGTHQHDAVLIPTKTRVSLQHPPLIFADFVSSVPNWDRITFQDSKYSRAPHSNDVALHLSACAFLL